MKKLICFLALCLLLGGCADTYDGPRERMEVMSTFVVDVPKQDGWGRSFRITYSYDRNGNLFLEAEYLPFLNKDGYVDDELVSTTRHYYDDAGNRTRSVRWDHAGLISLPTSRERMVYDEQNRLAEQIHLDAWGRELGRTTYSYDDHNRTVTRTESSGDTVIELFDLQGRLLWSMDAAGQKTTYAYSISEYGALITEVHFPDGGTAIKERPEWPSLNEEYAEYFDANGERIRTEHIYTRYIYIPATEQEEP